MAVVAGAVLDKLGGLYQLTDNAHATNFLGAVSGGLSSALFLGSCGAASVAPAAAVVSFSAGNPLAASGALAEWRSSLDE